MNEFTSYLKVDYREVSLEIIINGLNDAINTLKKQIDEIHWYDGDWFMEESEPIYGLAFIAFQNYINGSIQDFKGNLLSKQELYKIENSKSKYPKTKIELIISLANYTKHKDDGVPHKGTKEVLDCFKLNYLNVTYLDKSPIFQGLTILNKNWDLFKIKAIVTKWRKLLWNQEIELNI
ncbi:hypothetical protein [Confluentibacter flavum]|uniref:Uncharacterized protein n=1 Tax=Confluentibacter flavum TaxID=1909700 RepID=A0A2N3HJQ6_9FLAO|nr:hypothetical protein [Confluentibacter flavum]PKQ45196.1 hypothetical protein CSW08_09260 [Confluentibacter flavum]